MATVIKKSLEKNIQKAYQYLDSFSSFSNPDLLPGYREEGLTLLEELSAALEELAAMSEEIEQQNEELRTAQQALANQRKRYQDLFEFAPDGYLVTDVFGAILEANQAASSLLNVRPDHLCGKPVTLYVAPGDRCSFQLRLQQLIELQETVYWELNLQPRHQPMLTAGVTIATVQDAEEQVVGLRWLIRDISPLKQAEAHVHHQLEIEREFNQLKSQFTHIIHHEFRNPLGVISASAQLLERYGAQLSPAKKQQCFQRIHSNVEAMTELLDEIFWFDRAQSGQIIGKPQEINVDLLCRALVNQYQTKVSDQYKVLFACQGDCQSINLDADLLQLTLSHLLSNALKYSLVGSTVWLEVMSQGQQTSFSIRDQGIGIAPEDQPHLFEPFYRTQNADTLQGIGLGLAIAKQAAELQQGTISVVSEPGQGSTFTVTFPV